MIDQDELAKRIRTARENRGLTQKRVAGELGIARTAVVEIEAGRRAVSSLELSKLARLCGRAVEEFLEEAPFEEDALKALFRADPEAEGDEELVGFLRHQEGLCKLAGRLEAELGMRGGRGYEVSYGIAPPHSKWDAVRQGRRVAEEERRRLGLGSSPLWEIAEILREQGVRVGEAPFPEDVSGVFLHGRRMGAVVLVNQGHPRVRRIFALAHEYGHVLLDRDRAATVSRLTNQTDLIEVRANTFAAHLLMPPEGIRRVLQSFGKGESSRYFEEAYPGAWGGGSVVREGMRAQKRLPAGTQDLQLHDVAAVAFHFGMSFIAALYQLLNTGFLQRGRFEELREMEDLAQELLRELRPDDWERADRWSLRQQILGLALEAYRRERISRRKLLALTDDLGTRRELIERIIEESGWEDEPVEVRAPR